MGGSVNILKTNMKLAVIGLTTFLASISLAQDVVNEKAGNSIKVDTRAPSTYQNCNCQCDSYTWSDGNYIRGNCRSKAKLPGPSQATGLFCYISGSALCSCRDVQRSNSVVIPMEICAIIPSRLVQLLPEINALIMAGEVMEEMVEIMGMEIFHTVAILDQIKDGQVVPPTQIKDGQVGPPTQIKVGQVGPPTQIIGQEGPQIIDPVGPQVIDPVVLPAIDLVGHPVIDLVDHHLAIDPVVHPTIDPVIVLVWTIF